MELVEHVDVPHPGDGGWPDRGSLLQLLALSNNGGFKYNYKYKYYNCWVKCPSNIVGYNSNITLFLLQCLVGLFVNLCNLPASWWPILYKWYLHISPTTCGWDACGWANFGSLLKTSSTGNTSTIWHPGGCGWPKRGSLSKCLLRLSSHTFSSSHPCPGPSLKCFN